MTAEVLLKAKRDLDTCEAMTRYQRRQLHDQIVAAVEAGVSRGEVAKVAGITQARVGQIMKAAGKPVRSYQRGGKPVKSKRLGVSLTF